MNSRLVLHVLQLLFVEVVLGVTTTTPSPPEETQTSTVTWPMTTTPATLESTGQLPAETEATERQDPKETTTSSVPLTNIGTEEPVERGTTEATSTENSKSKNTRHVTEDSLSSRRLYIPRVDTLPPLHFPEDGWSGGTTSGFIDLFGHTKDDNFHQHHHHESSSSRLSSHNSRNHPSHSLPENDLMSNTDPTLTTLDATSSPIPTDGTRSRVPTRSPASRSTTPRSAGFSASSTTSATPLQNRENKFNNQAHGNSNLDKTGSGSKSQEQAEKDFFNNPFTKKSSASNCRLSIFGVTVAIITAARCALF